MDNFTELIQEITNDPNFSEIWSVIKNSNYNKIVGYFKIVKGAAPDVNINSVSKVKFLTILLKTFNEHNMLTGNLDTKKKLMIQFLFSVAVTTYIWDSIYNGKVEDHVDKVTFNEDRFIAIGGCQDYTAKTEIRVSYNKRGIYFKLYTDDSLIEQDKYLTSIWFHPFDPYGKSTDVIMPASEITKDKIIELLERTKS